VCAWWFRCGGDVAWDCVLLEAQHWKRNTGNKTDVTGVMYVFSVEGMNTFY